MFRAIDPGGNRGFHIPLAGHPPNVAAQFEPLLPIEPETPANHQSHNAVVTLAKRLGTTEHRSPLLRKAGTLRLHGIPELIALAVTRGCGHYRGGPEPVPVSPVPRAKFSDEELAVALLSPCLPYSPRAVRVGAEMLGARGNQPRNLAFLAVKERAETVVRYVARAGHGTEPQELFWLELLAALPPISPRSPEPPQGVMPHPSCFRSETGITHPKDSRTHGGPSVLWLRPSNQPDASTHDDDH